MSWRNWLNLSRPINHCSQALREANQRLQQEIAERREAESRVASLARFPDENRQPVLRIDQTGIVRYANAAARPLLAHWACPHPDDRPHGQPEIPSDWQARVQSALNSGDLVEAEAQYDDKWFLITLTPLTDAGYVNLYATDITERKAYEQALEARNRQDALTGLINRDVLYDRIDQAYRTDTQGMGFAVIVIDLENFRLVNSLLGHAGGDAVIVALAERLQYAVNPTATAARLDGDTFAVLLPNARAPAAISSQVEHWLDQLAAPIKVGDESAECRMAAGVALCPQDGESAHELLRNAHLAAHRARETQARQHFFVQTLNDQLQARHQRLRALKEAIEHNALIMHYQLQFDAQRRPVGAEALIRWPMADGYLIPPGDFIPLAEENGLIIPMGELALRQACEQARTWRAGGYPLPIAVNLGAEHVLDPGLPAFVSQLLERNNLPAADLQIEITESGLMHDVDAARGQLAQLRRMGVSVALDDFGTGHTAMAYLRDLPADHLKLDREFIRDLPDRPAHQAICEAVLTLGHAMGMSVVAEGIEHEAEFEMLRAMGIDHYQGFLLARPAAANPSEPSCMQ